jgi:hypothetical protein
MITKNVDRYTGQFYGGVASRERINHRASFKNKVSGGFYG